jgi:16S rRNA processing protein RimM
LKVEDMARPSRVLLGVIVTAHGIRGDVVVKTFTGDPEDIGAYRALTDKDGGRALDLSVRRLTPKGVIASVAGVNDRNGAEALKGAELWVDRDALGAVEDGEFFYIDLIGLKVRDLQGVEFGEIVRVENYGAGDLLEIRLSDSGKEELVPFQEAYVPDVDIEGGYVTVAWPLEYEIAQPETSDEDI